MLFGDAQQIMPVPLAAQLHQRHAAQPTIGDQGRLGCSQIWTDFIEHGCHQCPLSLLPVLLCWHHAPGNRQHPRMQEQSEIDHAGPLINRRTIQHKKQAFVSEIPQHLPEKHVPDLGHHDAFIGHKAHQSAFDPRHFRFTDAMLLQTLGHPLQHHTA